VIKIKKIYAKSLSFQSPAAPDVFEGKSVSPDIDIHIHLSNQKVAAPEQCFEVTMKVTATARNDGATVFSAEVQQAGIFRIDAEGEDLAAALEIACPNVLLPFVRESITGMAGKGGFPPLLINPIDFAAMHRSRRSRDKPPAAAPKRARGKAGNGKTPPKSKAG